MSVTQSCLTLCDPMDYVDHGILQARILEWVAFPFPGDLPNPGIKPRSPVLQVDSSPAEPPGKPKNTGVGSLSLLQGNFLTQESNQDILYCRQILHQLSYREALYDVSAAAAAAAKSLQSCSTLCDPMDCSPPGSSTHGLFQARILEWVAISFSRGSSQPRDQTWVSCTSG